MKQTLLEELSDFTSETSSANLPEHVADESVRIILDTIGCAFSGISHKRGQIGDQFGRLSGGDGATILATGARASAFGASFANAEAINALDFDAVLPPGHVSPYVFPPALATAEEKRSSGNDLIVAVAIAHEISNRIGKAMDYHRDIKDGKVVPPRVWGFASTVLGGTAATAKLRHLTKEQLAQAISLAALISPVNSASSWREHPEPPTIKYALGGWFAQTALTAAHLAEMGHRGDANIFDPEFGYPRFIGTSRWAPEAITKDIGVVWNFPREEAFKHYPHCRVLAAPLDALTDLIKEHKITVDEIERIDAWVEGFLDRPLWSNRNITDVTDAQFSVAHGLAVGAHMFTPGPDWQDEKNVFSESVLQLMNKVHYQAHPDYIKALQSDPQARPTRIVVHARGQEFVAERTYPKGTSVTDSPYYFSTPTLVEKFLVNASYVMSDRKAQELAAVILDLRSVGDINQLTAFISDAITVRGKTPALGIAR